MIYTNSLSHPNMFSTSSGKTMVDTAIESINRCIALLVQTGFGELFGQPELGSGLYEVTFDYVNNQYFDTLKNIIVDAITKFESRVTTNHDMIHVNVNPENNHIHITIGYSLNETNQYNETSLSVGVNINGQ